ncbi:UDP-N-acetylmuramate dehydrogenase [Enterococcus sp. FDAARGOS_553]|jgi:UDP-N-acetylmuramate dehydrogenase|nr:MULTISPECIES: UDP-N-acetylmuramate dehydrogenase [Enterococcus]AYY09940.1 UDP-N-acetylmuramate dehydrogenase [Enterococcus sp. FDAARGOS_553]QCT91842.1 UDP-N-acetylmuramate dehydrogenase [Enterococcus sp. M190262]TKL07491.1 UDP-N-acetylmuramate dehydrogenase [Enterococcus sp. ARL09-542]KIL80995.1 UDP-N-acetylenolpyruvoylglucosamine reductase [Enterococcus gallinarum]MBO6325480.1 UDP-N-acetylmuramate dehydrogenase [Enterococcus gallinarum]
MFNVKGLFLVNKELMIKQFPEIALLKDEALLNYTYTKTGGPADILAFPKSAKEVEQIVAYCRETDTPWLVLGNASNLIVRDGGIRGVVIMLSEMNQITVEDTTLIVEAGAKLIDTTYVALHESLTGFEFACGIPGSVGGAVFMNAGAYDGEIQDIFASCDVLLADGRVVTMMKEEMAFSYRHSTLQDQHAIILSARFDLAQGDQDQIKKRMDELTELRQLKQPLEYPSCGSVFKRPVGHFTGKLIQDAGLQGLKWGGAQISEKHAGFIVNVDHATATDYVELIAHIQQVIKERFDVQLETEVRIIGEEAK